MTSPSQPPGGGSPKPRGCITSYHDGRTGELTVAHHAERPKVVVQLDDGRQVPLEEYLANRDADTPGPGDEILLGNDAVIN